MASLNGDSESGPITTSSTQRSSADPIKLWKRAVRFVTAANKFNILAGPEVTQVDQEICDHEGSSTGRNGSSNGQYAYGNPITQSPIQATPSQHSSDDLGYLRIVQGALVQQLNAFGFVLTLLATVTSVAILQPPGSFDGDGHVRPYRLLACYLLFASLSFLLACTGLFAVIVGQASLYRPGFYPVDSAGSQRLSVQKLTPKEGFDEIPTLKLIVEDNLSRVRRLKTYLGFSLAMGMTAYVCGAFAILGPGQRNLWMAVGTIGVSFVILATEGVMTWRGPALPPTSLARLQQIIH
ncbi:hypothetical protein KC19_12G075400 [Ceratodon purpureus]|uniref:Uncharacterized protein n=1 Tax=Ceratodon purpureus TaxID=3225 RepID=A0A8T0G4M0_CERPU|nr:hypothetical protein KC19_12G075400 [Ceratodon purpureus]